MTPDALDRLRKLAEAAKAPDACAVCHGEFAAAIGLPDKLPDVILSLLDALDAREAIPREPTEAMIDAVADVIVSGAHPHIGILPQTRALIWRRMYDAALRGGKP